MAVVAAHPGDKRRTATCRCGQLRAVCLGEPVRVSICHCRACQLRSGSAFAVQARWPDARVSLSGPYRAWSRTGDSGKRATYHFCPNCGSTVVYFNEAMPDLTAVAVGAFLVSDLPLPTHSGFERRKHSWVEIVGDDIDHAP